MASKNQQILKRQSIPPEVNIIRVLKFVVTTHNSRTAIFICLATKRKDSGGSGGKEKHESQIDYVELRFAQTGPYLSISRSALPLGLPKIEDRRSQWQLKTAGEDST